MKKPNSPNKYLSLILRYQIRILKNIKSTSDMSPAFNIQHDQELITHVLDKCNNMLQVVVGYCRHPSNTVLSLDPEKGENVRKKKKHDFCWLQNNRQR